MSDSDDVESLQAEREILLARIVRLQDQLKGKGMVPYEPEEMNWIEKVAARQKKADDEKSYEIMWGVIVAFVMVVIIAGLVNRFVEWAFGIGIGI